MEGRRCRSLPMLRRQDRISIQIHRIDGTFVRLVGALHRFFALLLKNARAVLLTLDLLVEEFIHLALVRLETGDHRLDRLTGLFLFRFVQQDLAAEAVNHDLRFTARADDFEVLGHGDTRGHSNACRRSAIRSSLCSSPTESRRSVGGVFDVGPSLDWRCSIRLSTPPNDVARVKTFVFAATPSASSRPPFTRNDIIPPKSDI